jgi:putative transposase
MALHDGRLASAAIVHTDRGSPFTSAAHRRELDRIGARQSLPRSGSCLDNAPAEAIDHWIAEYYNTRRLHSTLGYRTPAEVRSQHAPSGR